MRVLSLHQLRLLVGALVFLLSSTFAAISAGEESSMNGEEVGLAGKAHGFNKDLPRIREAMEVQKRHTRNLMDTAGVVATGTGLSNEGMPVIKVFTSRAGIKGIPDALEGIPVHVKISGRIYALQDGLTPSSKWPHPVPTGVSTGHPDITAGTIGARVKDSTDVYALSNNHVYANVNQARIGDNVLQPGAYDGGRNPEDAIGTLYAFEPIKFCYYYWIWLQCPEVNQIDAAIAHSTVDFVGCGTPPDGYGTPNKIIHPAYGVPDVTGDEDLAQLLGLNVQKYGRTTALTKGAVDAINATVDVCYDDSCSQIARFVDQIIIKPGTFSGGGDSGSLIVTDEAAKNPVGLLFAGSDTETIANRIDLVLNRFSVTIDDGLVGQVTDIAITAVNAPSPVLLGDSVSVQVIAQNLGTEAVASEFGVTLVDKTDGQTIGTQTVSGLGVGASTTLTFLWDTTSETPGNHILEATHNAEDDVDGNDAASKTVQVMAPATGPKVLTGKVPASTAYWTKVALNYYYNSMVVVCSVNYDRNTPPLIPHVRNASGNSFELNLAPAFWSQLPGDDYTAQVHYMVVEEGTYNASEHGVKMEAAKFISTRTDRMGSWVGQKRSYAQAYSSPVVVGQVMSANTPASDPLGGLDYLFSAFWCRGSSAANPPTSKYLYVGKHIGEDTRARNSETIGYVVIEAGSGKINDRRYVARLGGDTVRGVGNVPPYTYSFSNIGFTPSAAIISQAAMDASDGGWAILYGTNPVTATQLKLAIDEDWAISSERNHTTEQVGYLLLE